MVVTGIHSTRTNGAGANWRRSHSGYPFPAVVGYHAAKRALLLLAIEPGLRGVLIATAGGSNEITLARALGSLLPALAADSSESSEQFPNCFADCNVVDLPLNIAEGQLLGELDLERTISSGKREISAGLLSRANGRVLLANDINLLDPSVAAHVARALDSRQVLVEREGISASHEADFILVGIFRSNDGEPSSILRDRIGLMVDGTGDWSLEDEAEIIERAFRFERDPFSFADSFALETAQLKCEIEEARARLPRVRISKNQVRQISQIAFELGVEGNRADVFALKAARASAALAGREAVTEDDLVIAIQLVLAPRATSVPRRREESGEDTESSIPETLEETGRSEADEAEMESIPRPMEDMIIQALDARVPIDSLSREEHTRRQSRAGKRFKASGSTRGRYMRSTMSESSDRRVAIDATLRAAAPYQLLRRRGPEPDTKSSFDREDSSIEVLSDELPACRDRSATRVRRQAGSSSDNLGLRCESRQTRESRRVKIEPGDLRFKEFRHRSGILFIFAVDASGSMALNRMAQAKGALTRLLQQAYLHRDQVSLISFRGESAEVLLAPTRSVELAKRLVDALPAGGGTPLSAGIVKAIELVQLARLRGTSEAMLVLFTDGRANVGLDRAASTSETIVEELVRLGAFLGSAEIKSVIVDTKSKFVSNGEGEELARLLDASYVYLPRSDAAAVYNAIASITGRPSES